MLKKCFIVMAFIALCPNLFTQASFAQYEDTDYDVVTNFSDINFDSGAIDPNDFMSYDISTKGGYGLSVVEDSDEHGNVMKTAIKSEDIIYDGSTITISNGNWSLSCPGKSMQGMVKSGNLIFEFDIKFENFISNNRLFYVNTTGGGDCIGPVVNASSGELNLIGNRASGKKLEKNKWYTFKFVIDVDVNTIDSYLDGEIIQKGYQLGDKFKDIKYFNLPRFLNFGSDNYSVCYIDNIKLYNIGKKYNATAYTMSNETITENLDNFPLTGASVYLEFSEAMQDLTKDNFVFTINGAEKDFDMSYSAEDNSVTITPKNSFSGREKCRIDFINVLSALGAGSKCDPYIEFIVGPPLYCISNITHSELIPGETSTISVSVENKTEEERKEILLVGIYNGLQLLSVSTIEAVNPAGASPQTFNVPIDIPEDYSFENCNIRAYIVKAKTLFGLDTLAIK